MARFPGAQTTHATKRTRENRCASAGAGPSAHRRSLQPMGTNSRPQVLFDWRGRVGRVRAGQYCPDQSSRAAGSHAPRQRRATCPKYPSKCGDREILGHWRDARHRDCARATSPDVSPAGLDRSLGRSRPTLSGVEPPAPPARSGPTGRQRTGVLRSSLAQMKSNRVNVAAGAFAFRWFLAFFPMMIALLGIASIITIPRHVVVSLVHGVTKAVPSGAAQVFTKAISNAVHHSSAGLATTVVACVVALWSATSAMVIVEEGLDMAYGLPADRSFLAKRVAAMPLLVGAVVLGGSASALIIFGPQLGNLIKSSAPIGGTAFATLWTIIRWIFALALMNLLFSLLYCLAPNRQHPRCRWTSAGALLATILWALVSLGFSFYTSSFGSYATTYGAFAGVAIFIFWLYLTGVALLVGAEVNAAIERRSTPGIVTTATSPATG